MSENDLRVLGRCVAMGVPCVDDGAACVVLLLVLVDTPGVFVGVEGLVCVAVAKVARGFGLPRLVLASYLVHLDHAASLGNGAHGCPGLDGGELPGVADEHDLSAGIVGA